MNRTIGAMLSASILSACAVTSPGTVDSGVGEKPAGSWFAPTLAHQGSSVALADWWGQFNDPVLSDWIAKAQAQSPTIAATKTQVMAARLARISDEVLSGPQLALVGSGSRGEAGQQQPLGTSLAGGLQASWALDLWGGSQASIAQSLAKESAAGAGWHEARVLVASEMAQVYFGLRLCQTQLSVAERDRDSRAVTAKSAAQTERAGLTAPAVAALAKASAADGAARARQQSDQCERQIKAAVALTAQPEPALRSQLAKAPSLHASTQMQSMLNVPAVPMDAIRQRPDVYRAQANWVAAAEGVGVARAAMLPSLSFSGNWLRNRFSGGGTDSSFNSWSIGPLSVSVPLIGRYGLSANLATARSAYESSGVAYTATLRQAVAEVEQSLVALDGLREREQHTAIALEGYAQSFKATEARYRVGFANLNELEDARRLQLNAQSGAIALQQERINTWIGLYVALGGGFDPENNLTAIKDPS